MAQRYVENLRTYPGGVWDTFHLEPLSFGNVLGTTSLIFGTRPFDRGPVQGDDTWCSIGATTLASFYPPCPSDPAALTSMVAGSSLFACTKEQLRFHLDGVSSLCSVRSDPPRPGGGSDHVDRLVRGPPGGTVGAPRVPPRAIHTPGACVRPTHGKGRSGRSALHQHQLNNVHPTRAATCARPRRRCERACMATAGTFAQTTVCGTQGLTCQNGGECITNGGGSSAEYSCKCPTDWINGKTYRGRQCETESVECGGGVWCVNNGAECGARDVDWAHGDGREECESDGGVCKSFDEWSFGAPQEGQRRFYLCEGGSRNGTFCNSATGCSCPTGFTGRHCEQRASEVSDDRSTPCGPSGLICHNGGECRQRGSGDSADYFCDCNRDWVNGRTFRGLRCELETLECGGGVWCANNGAECSARDVDWAHGDGHDDCESGGGTCRSYGSDWNLGYPQAGHNKLWLCVGGNMNGLFCNSATGCSCPTGYTGRHCDILISGSNDVGAQSSSDSSSLSGGAIAGIVISAIVATVAVVVVLFMYRKERAGKPMFLPFTDENTGGTKSEFQ
eukprot:scaffold656_cov403-Pavlova_lutheri.AAC.34